MLLHLHKDVSTSTNRTHSVHQSQGVRLSSEFVRTAANVSSPLFDTAYVKGTVNDPTPFPEPNAAHGSNHWAFERALSVALVPLVGVGMVKHGSSALLDGALALTLVVHSHIGFDCILADYLHKRKFPILGPLSSWGLRALTLTTLYGLYEFNTSKFPLRLSSSFCTVLTVPTFLSTQTMSDCRKSLPRRGPLR